MVQRARRISIKLSAIFSLALAAFLTFFGKGPASNAQTTTNSVPSGATRPAGAMVEEQRPPPQVVNQQPTTNQTVDQNKPILDQQRPTTQAVDYQKPLPK